MGINGSLSTPRALDVAASQIAAENELFIGKYACPRIDVTLKDAKVPISALRASMLQPHSSLKRAPGATAAKVDFRISETQYSCEEYVAECPIDTQYQFQYQSAFDVSQNAVRKVTYDLLIDFERRVSSLLFNTTTFSTANGNYNDVSSTPWATVSNLPINDITSAMLALAKNAGGLQANTLIISDNVLASLLKNTDIKTMRAYTGLPGRQALIAAIKDMTGLNLLVGPGTYNGISEGIGTFSATNIWSSSYALVCALCPENASMDVPSLARTFAWNAFDKGDYAIDIYRQEDRKSDVYRATQFRDEVIVDSALGYLLKVA